MNRRRFIANSAAIASLAALPSQGRAALAAISATQAPLPYAPEALEPHIDAATMKLHHGKHHATYVTKLNEALVAAKLPADNIVALLGNLSQAPAEQQSALRNHGGGHVNHTWFWNWMAPAGTGPAEPQGPLAEALQANFGSLADFKKAFGDAATKRFGSGWAWLIVKGDGKLAITTTANQDNPLMKGVVPDAELGTPILGLDVWEHAYYLKYQNKRPDYIGAWWNVVNWKSVADGLAASKA